MIRLFASDMDGTLLNEHHIISDENAAAVKQLQQHGIEFMIATGRDYRSATQLLNAQNIQCSIVALNGACIYDANGMLLYQRAIDPQATNELIQYLLAHNIQFVIQSDSNFYVADMKTFVESALAFTDRYGDNVHDLTVAQMRDYVAAAQELSAFSNPVAEPILKFMISSDRTSDLDNIRHLFDANPHLDITSSAPDNLEITSNAAQKGLALKYYATHKGITMQEVAGIGDSLNDRSMLQMVGYSFAMANAPEFIKQLAKYHAPANIEHGVAQIIAQVIAGNYS
ncbi:Cof-type HAD-IIB family hydrolase [Aerococcaceae bacterium NML190938]|nr:Cof-type HAD-IIB family hydrolase [Aerococcaceae bacterium NML190938]